VTLASQSSLQSPALFFPALYIVAFGTGGLKPNVSPFGADQFDTKDKRQAKEKEGFWNWFYFSINSGALVSYLAIAYLCQDVSFSVGYLVPTISMFLAVIMFWLGRHRYTQAPPTGSVVSRFVGILWQALWVNRKAVSVRHFLDKAQEQHGGRFSASEVNDAKYVIRLLPFCALYFVYWGCYTQMATTWYTQGCQMNLKLGSFELPVAALNVFDTLIIVLTIPLFEKCLFPALKRRGLKMSSLCKIGLGFFLACLGMIVSALVEIARKRQFDEGKVVGTSVCSDSDESNILAVEMSVFWQVPQFLLIGISEVFASATALDFFYSEAPDSMKSVCSALNLLNSAIGSWLIALLVPLVNLNSGEEWIPQDANYGHLDYFFWLLGALMGVNLLIFYFVARRYTYKNDDSSQEDKESSKYGAVPDYQSTATHNQNG